MRGKRAAGRVSPPRNARANRVADAWTVAPRWGEHARRISARAGVVVAAILLGAGCAHTNRDLETQVRELKLELATVRAELRRCDRRSDSKTSEATPRVGGEVLPPLPVVRARPGAGPLPPARSLAPPRDEAALAHARGEIVVPGTGGLPEGFDTMGAPRGGTVGSDRDGGGATSPGPPIEFQTIDENGNVVPIGGQAPPAGSQAPGRPAQGGGAGDQSMAPPPPHEGATVEETYRRGLEALRARRYDEAERAFDDILARAPQHALADNALYWKGEVYYDQHDFQHALGLFRDVVERYPLGNKVPDAMVKAALCLLRLGVENEARSLLRRVIEMYPDSDAAEVARQRLPAM